MPNKTFILGAGISGISAGYHLKEKGISSVIFEQDKDWGGLCGHFMVDGFRFDRFVHFSFPDDPDVWKLFDRSSPLAVYPSVASNYYHGIWLKHPAQSNLAPLPWGEKIKIISDFIRRPKNKENQNYEDWLRAQYGNYFAEHFPLVYTRKYWGVEAKNLETKWIGDRMQRLNLKTMLIGAFKEQKKNFYYTEQMNYPQKGGFRSILNTCREGLDIRFEKKVIRIDPQAKKVFFADGTIEPYDRLISSLPLPEIVKMINGCPDAVTDAAKHLCWTKGYQVSLGFKRSDVAKYLWFYVYDEDMAMARVYSPNLKSADNVPAGCSALQAEIFFNCRTPIPSADEILKKTVVQLQKICSFTDEDIIAQDIRLETYANIIFTPDIYQNRKIVMDYLKEIGIDSIGRFGRWDYLWSHQAFNSGKEVASCF